MRYSISCAQCPVPVAYCCPNFHAAEDVRDRHNKLRGHQATIVRHLDTPHEGLL